MDKKHLPAAVLAIWACRISGSISLLCSASILRIVLGTNEKSPKNNILVGLSVMDILQSLAFIASSAPSPAGSWYGSIGNSVTCKIQGFMVQLGFGVPCYSASLALFYLLVVGKEYGMDSFAKNIEPYCHILSVGLPLLSAILLISFNKLGAEGAGLCWVFDSLHPEDTLFIATLSGGLIVAVCNIFVLYAMGFIVMTIRKRRMSMRRYSFNGREPTVLVEMEKNSLQQGLLFSMAYFFTYIPSAIAIAIPAFGADVDENEIFQAVVVAQNVLLPLHGFWNLFIYSVPLVKRVRSRDTSTTIRAVTWLLLSNPAEFHQVSSQRVSRRPSVGITTGTTRSSPTSVPRETGGQTLAIGHCDSDVV